MTGTFINIAAVLIGGTVGRLFGGRLPDRTRQTVIAGLGLFTAAFGVLSFFATENAIVVLVSLLLWIGVAKAAEVGSLNGVLQRVFILSWFVWVEVMAIRLFRISRGESYISEARSLIQAGGRVN